MKQTILALVLSCLSLAAAEKKIVLLAGSASHGPGEHEFNAGCHLLQKCLDAVPGVKTEIYTNGWPHDPMRAFDGASAIFLYSDGGDGNPFNRPERREIIDRLLERGIGLGCAHYAVEVPQGATGDAFSKWIGGYFLTNWSVNPTWTAEFKSLPRHPITSGVHPFKIHDEWYYHMKFRDGMQGVTPILSAVAPPTTLGRSDGTHSGNPAVREAVAKGDPQIVMWATERPDGGRGFGFTGAHYHKNWANEDFRKSVLNAILWSAKMDVPKNGVECSISEDDLKANLDPKGKRQ
ncbi:MAG TPA: ThuA domain-containing protein [Verrucomicrobiae bacterium]|nr:ThuA domain-containing protein [Verrucomicrobiae bacterium]